MTRIEAKISKLIQLQIMFKFSLEKDQISLNLTFSVQLLRSREEKIPIKNPKSSLLKNFKSCNIKKPKILYAMSLTIVKAPNQQEILICKLALRKLLENLIQSTQVTKR